MSTQQSSQTSPGAREVRKKASERLGQWIRKKYRLEQLLGVGGMAAVYSATHRNGSRVAIKIMHAEFAREDAIKQRFLREGYVANKVDHDGRVAIIDDDETEQGEPYLVMELLEGESLQQIWKRCRRKIPVLDALRIAADVLDTLVPFHDQRIIHRDLKPANIFVTHDGVVKLLDFGVAQLREEGGEALTRAGTALGTPSYMSPEQAMGKSDQLDGRSDVFAVGATLYAILSGRRLHHGKSDNEAFILAATQPAPSLARSASQLPVEVIALVDKALQWDRRRRFKNAADMRDACRKLLVQLAEMDDVDRTSVLPERMSVAPTMMDSPDARRMTSTAPDPEAAKRAAASMQAPDGSVGPGTRAGVGAPPVQSPAPRAAVGEPTPGPYTPMSSPSHSHTPMSSPSHGTGPHTPLSSPSHGTSSFGTPGPRPAVPRQPMRTGTRIARPTSSGSQPPIAAHERLESSAPTRESEAPAADDKDKVMEIFRRLEKALPSLRHYGLDHPEGQQKIRAVHRCMLDALREDPESVRWEVHPFCFSRGGEPLWEPGPPYDLVPYGLASTGIESVSVQAGVTEEELQAFLKAVVVDPQHGVDDDIAAALWEAGLQHIQCKVRDDLAGNNARARVKFFDESEQVESDLRVELAEVVDVMASLAAPSLDVHGNAEASALALSADKGSFWVGKASSEALQLDAAVRTALGSQMDVDDDEWRDRFFDVAVEAFADALEREDAEVLLEPMKRHSRQLAATAHWRELFELHDTLLGRLASAGHDGSSLLVSQALFSWPIVERAFADARSDRVDPEARALLVEGLWGVVPALPSNLTAKFLGVANDIPGGELLDLALSYVEGTLAGNEAAVIEMLDDIRPDLAQRVLASMTNSGDESVRELLKPLMASKSAALRCEATALLSQSPEMLAQHLVKMLNSGDPKLRMAALNTMTRHEVRVAGPALVRFVEGDTFSTRERDEQAKLLEALHALSAARAERVCVDLLEKHGMLADEALDQVRILAAETLGRYASGQDVIQPLDNASRLRPWNTQALRNAASAALAAVRTRMADDARSAASGGEP